MSEKTRRNRTLFWSVVDEILNSLLFMLIGFEMLGLARLESSTLFVIALAIPLGLLVRAASIIRHRLVASCQESEPLARNRDPDLGRVARSGFGRLGAEYRLQRMEERTSGDLLRGSRVLDRCAGFDVGAGRAPDPFEGRG
jgi:hypothetical protein